MKSVHIVCNEIVQCVVQTVHMCFVVLWCKIHCTASLAQMFQRPIVIHANCPHKNHNIVNSLHYTYLVQLLQVVHSTQLSFSVSSIYWARTEMMPIHPKLHIRYLIDGWIDVSLDLFLQIQPTFRSHHFFCLWCSIGSCYRFWSWFWTATGPAVSTLSQSGSVGVWLPGERSVILYTHAKSKCLLSCCLIIVFVQNHQLRSQNVLSWKIPLFFFWWHTIATSV